MVSNLLVTVIIEESLLDLDSQLSIPVPRTRSCSADWSNPIIVEQLEVRKGSATKENTGMYIHALSLTLLSRLQLVISNYGQTLNM